MTSVTNWLASASRNMAGMKARVCFLVMFLAPLIYYGMLQLAPAGKAATVSAQFRGLGKYALSKIETAQDAESTPDFDARLADADRALTTADGAAHTEADRRDYTRLVSYLQAVKQDHQLMQADPTSADHEQMNSARQSAEQAFN